MSAHKRLVVQVRADQWEWLKNQSGPLQPVSPLVRSLIDKAMTDVRLPSDKTT